ncbi:MAG: molybdopterin-dependent oxidoreductase [Paracoccaceae bacterium]
MPKPHIKFGLSFSGPALAGIGFAIFAGVSMGAYPALSDNVQRAAITIPQPDTAPKGTVVLTVTVADGARSQQYLFDRENLQSLPQDTFSTTTIWTEGMQEFQGVRIHKLMQALKVEQGMLSLTAINDYMVEMPVADLRADGALIAYLRNGAPMTARDKGPLWVVFPYDTDPQWRTETVYARSVWQLDRIAVER